MTESKAAKKTAGAFDIRFVIAGLIGAYGLILTVYGAFFTSQAQIDKADGFHVNLWGGIALLVFAVAFFAWGRLRPVVIKENPPAAE